MPAAACWTLRAISAVAADCSSTAEAMADAIWSMLRMRPTMPAMAATTSAVTVCTAPIWALMSLVARAVRLARF